MKIVVTPKTQGPLSQPAPAVSESFGENARADFRVYIVTSALAEMLLHGREDLSSELGGVMLGHHGLDDHGEYVVVEQYVPALRAKGRAASLTFDHEAWREINAIKDERFPELQVIGWYHTHPGYGIFLSGYDRFIDENWFKTAHHIAAVFDPTQKMPEALGVFVWASDGSGRLRSGFATCEPNPEES